jgi:hypothetical protein
VLGGVLNGFEPARAEDRYDSYDDRRGLVSRLLTSMSGDADGQLARPAHPRSAPAATSYIKDGLPTRSGHLVPPGIKPRENTRPRPRVDRAENGGPPADSKESSSPGADLGSTG